MTTITDNKIRETEVNEHSSHLHCLVCRADHTVAAARVEEWKRDHGNVCFERFGIQFIKSGIPAELQYLIAAKGVNRGDALVVDVGASVKVKSAAYGNGDALVYVVQDSPYEPRSGWIKVSDLALVF